MCFAGAVLSHRYFYCININDDLVTGMDENEVTRNDDNKSESSCVPGISRKKFLETVMRRAVIGGVLVVGAHEVGKFVLPALSSTTATSTGS